MAVDVRCECMEDFWRAAGAKKVEPLRKLLEARRLLSNLLTYMDGKSGAEDLMAKVMSDPNVLKALASAPKPQEGGNG